MVAAADAGETVGLDGLWRQSPSHGRWRRRLALTPASTYESNRFAGMVISAEAPVFADGASAKDARKKALQSRGCSVASSPRNSEIPFEQGSSRFCRRKNCRAPPQPYINPGLAEVSKRVADVTAPLQPVKNIDRYRRRRCFALRELGDFYSIIQLVILSEAAWCIWNDHCLSYQ